MRPFGADGHGRHRHGGPGGPDGHSDDHHNGGPRAHGKHDLSQIAGRARDVALDDPDVLRASERILAAFNAASTLPNLYAVVAITAASRQVVAGLRYKLALDVAPTQCGATETARTDCAVADGAAVTSIEGSVWARPWLKDEAERFTVNLHTKPVDMPSAALLPSAVAVEAGVSSESPAVAAGGNGRRLLSHFEEQKEAGVAEEDAAPVLSIEHPVAAPAVSIEQPMVRAAVLPPRRIPMPPREKGDGVRAAVMPEEEELAEEEEEAPASNLVSAASLKGEEEAEGEEEAASADGPYEPGFDVEEGEDRRRQ